jgi:hypothetical protein
MHMWQTSNPKVHLSGDMNEIQYIMNQGDIADVLDHSLLRPDATSLEKT